MLIDISSINKYFILLLLLLLSLLLLLLLIAITITVRLLEPGHLEERYPRSCPRNPLKSHYSIFLEPKNVRKTCSFESFKGIF